MNSENNRILLWGNCYAFFVTGMGILMTGAILPYLLKDFNLSYDQGGLLLSLQAIGNLSSGIISGIVAVYLGRKTTLVLGAVCFALGFGGTLFAPSAFWLMLFLTVSGLGWGTFNNLVNAVVSDAMGGKGSVTNLLHAFFAIGAFIAPSTVGVFIKANLGWHSAVLTVTVLSVILIFVFLFMPIGVQKMNAKKEKLSFNFLSNYRYFVFMGILFFYVGTESSINGWIVTYLLDSGIMNEITAQTALSILWVAFIIGRLSCAYISTIFSKEKIVLWGSVSAVIFFVVFLMSRNPLAIMFLVFGVGLSLAGICPTAIANASYLTKGSSFSNGILLSCGGMGASVVPYFVGMFSESKGIFTGMLPIIVSALLMTVLAVFNALTGRRLMTVSNYAESR